jgi:hypothetical protein
MPKQGGPRNNAGPKPKFRGKRYTVYLNADHCELVPGLFAEYIRGAIKARLVSDGLIQE